MEKTFYKSRLRTKGQITVPAEIRSALGVSEGDDLVFYTDEQGQVMISRAQIIPPNQAWFWSKRWQKLEHEAQSDLEAGRLVEFSSVSEALAALDQLEADDDAEN
jgi:AbrB family looped-hinge helix DNA binding protein